jgi:hypothetical protein
MGEAITAAAITVAAAAAGTDNDPTGRVGATASLWLPPHTQKQAAQVIADREDEINGLRGEVVAYPFVIGEHQEVHY